MTWYRTGYKPLSEPMTVYSTDVYMRHSAPVLRSQSYIQCMVTNSICGQKHLWEMCSCRCTINTLRPRRNRRLFAYGIFKCIFLNENVWIAIKISLKFIPKGPVNNIPALLQIMAWRLPGDKSLSEPMMVWSLTHICVMRPEWVE